MKSIRVFQHLDTPSRVLIWRADHFALLVLPVFLGIALESILICLGGIPIVLLFRWVRGEGNMISPQSLIYWKLGFTSFKKFPKSCKREFIL